METLEIPERERRNVQRDMLFLSEMDGGRYIQAERRGRSICYCSTLPNADRLLFPNFENTMLHFVFLKRIANIYPATSDIISSLLDKIENSLPFREKYELSQLSNTLNKKILFMGTPPDFEENTSEKIRVILQAIRDHRKIEVEYPSRDTYKCSTRIPLMIIIYGSEIYIGCESETHAGSTYTLKFRRIKTVKLLKQTFTETPKVLEKLRRQVISGAVFLSDQEPNLVDVELEFTAYTRFYLLENAFNRSMQIGKEKNGHIIVKMKAENNELLFNWVVSFSDSVRVIKPLSLCKKLNEYANYLKKLYGNKS